MSTRNVSEHALELGRAMTEMKNCMRQFVQARIKESNIDITFEMLELMACLWSRDGINQQVLADETIKDKSSMTYLVDNLVKRNLVMRVADENDRRNNLIFLTQEGKNLQKKLHPWLLDLYSKASAQIAADDMEKTVQLIRKMIDNLK